MQAPRSTALAVAVLTAVALAGCSSGSGGGDRAGGTTTPTTTTTVTVAPPSSSSSSTSSGSSSGSPVGSGTTSASSPGSSSNDAASGTGTCTAASVRTRAELEPGSAGAGSFTVRIVATNTGRSTCTTQGYPGVSLTAPETGKQLGAAADRESGRARPVVRLAPGKTAVALVRVAQAANFGSTCHATEAAGFRVYLPGDRTAEFAPYTVPACSTASVHQLAVQPFTA